LFLLFFLSKVTEATHIVGGEIYYDYLGGNNYKIHMKVYRDCINGIPQLDNPAFITVFKNDGTVYATFQMTLLSTTNMPPTNNSPCAPNTSNSACVQQGIYEETINLPPSPGGYYIAYQRCCRNGTILNLISPGGVGTTYWEHIPGPEVVAINSSPRFNELPPIYICNELPIAFDHAATDPDGDSLVYELCTPFNGLDGCCPIIGGGVGGGQFCPNPPTSCPTENTPPPYVSVPFIAPYSASYPMASNPAININSNTGYLDGNPLMLGQWVVGVCVSEYRNGVLIGTHHRDFQFNVISCPFVVSADIVSQTTTNNGQGTGYCNGFTISYSNNSFNGSTYFWDFGDPSTLADTSHLYNPTYTFPAVGDYTVTLIVNPGSTCGDTTTEVFHVHPLLKPDFLEPNGQCLENNSFDFFGGGVFEGNGSFNWSFGSNANPTTANTATVNNVSFNVPGVYTVSFTVNENGCSATASKTIEVYQNPEAVIGNFTPDGCVPQVVTFQNNSTAGTPMTHLWSFSDGTTSTQLNPTKTFSVPGVYSVSLTVMTSQKCIDTSNVVAVNNLTVYPIPVSTFSIVSASDKCFDNNSFDFTAGTVFQGATGVLDWSFGSDANPSVASTAIVNNVTYNTHGLFPVTLIAEENGCSSSTTQTIELYPNPVAGIQPVNAAGCDPQIVNFQNISTGASSMNYLWEFSDGTTSTEENPQHIFTPPGIYNYTLTVTTFDKCIDTNSVASVSSITVSPSPVSTFTATPRVVSIFEPDINFYNMFANDVVSWIYHFGDGGTSLDEIDPMHTYSTWGDYTVTLTVSNQYDCANTSDLLIRILPEFRFWVPNSFTPGKADGLNDIFKPITIGVEDYTFYIFNRWGELIYKTNDTEAGWNGTFKEKASPMDVYIWKCDFKNVVTKEHEYHVGHVTLVR
jgi:gliding motility-associated-like protein